MNTPTEPNRNDQSVRNDAPRAEAPVDSQRIKNTFPLAVIELGTSAIRMAIGESDGSLSVRVLEQLVRGVSLGKDTFTNGEIQRKTLQECVKVLKSYRRKLKESNAPIRSISGSSPPVPFVKRPTVWRFWTESTLPLASLLS